MEKMHQTDWSFSQAAANTRLVGLEVANLIVVLVDEHQVCLVTFFTLSMAYMDEHQAEARDFHIIGHSLGAHIAGYAGERIPGLGRWLDITFSKHLLNKEKILWGVNFLSRTCPNFVDGKKFWAGFLASTLLSCSSRECLALFVLIQPTLILLTWYTR